MSITHAEKGRLQKRVAKYVWKLRDEMWLGRWTIDVLVTEYPGESSNNGATVTPAAGQHRADIEISVNTAEDGGAHLRHVLVHELIHLYHRDCSDQIRLGLKRELSESAYRLFWAVHLQAIELMVDDMAEVWSRTLPLPDWPEEE